MASSEPGLEVFDDAASAVGNFPSALRGYDRSAVDDYVRSLEGAVVANRRRSATLQQQVNALEKKIVDVEEKAKAAEIDFSNLGERAREILRLAEDQARDIANQANSDADRIRELARREADQVRQEAQQAGQEIKASGIAEIEQLRVRGQEDIRSQVDKTQAESEAIIAAARRQAEALQRAADHEAQTLRQNAYLDTENLRRSAEREVADMRREVAEERELAVNHLRTVQEEAAAKTTALLAEAADHARQSAERLEADIAEGARIRAEALAGAERVKTAAATEAEERLVAARKQAAAIGERTHQEFNWRKQQLRREMDLLAQRRQAVLNQLASLSALAEQTTSSFPDLDDLEGFDAEQGDQTITMPPGLAPALPPDRVGQAAEEKTPARPEGVSESAVKTREISPVSGDGAQRSEGSTEAAVAQPPAGAAGNSPEDDDDDSAVEIDGDATILVPTSQLPAGTAHLRGSSGSQSS